MIVTKKQKGQPTAEHDDAEQTVVWVMSTGRTDRDGETVDPEGGNFDEFMLNPTVQWNHDTDAEPIGHLKGAPWNDYVGEGTKYPEISGPKRMALLGRVKFDSDARSRALYEKTKERLASGGNMGGSISFVPLGRTSKNNEGGNHYGQWKLLEFTVCSVGSNPDAVATRKKCLNCACKTVKDKAEVVESAVGGWAVVDGYEVVGRYGSRAEAEAAKARIESRTGKRMKVMTVDKGWENWAMMVGNALGIVGGALGHSPTAVIASSLGLGAAAVWEIMQQQHRQGKSPKEAARELESKKSLKAAPSPHRKGKKMKRRAWVKGKSLWLLQKDGGIDAEVQEYVEERGLDEVRLEDKEPTVSEWVEEEMEEPEHQDAPVQMARTDGPPSGKTEDVADDVATRSAELCEMGVDETDAVEASMDEQQVPKGMRAAVKALVARKRKKINKSPKVEVYEDNSDPNNPGWAWRVRFDDGHEESGEADSRADGQKQAQDAIRYYQRKSKQATPEALSAYQQGQKDALKFVEDTGKEEAPMEVPIETSVKRLRPGHVVRTNSGNLCLVKSIGRKSVTVVKVNGDEVEADEKSLSIKLKSEGWGLPTKMNGGTWGLAAKLTHWYGRMANEMKTFAPALKDEDLTGEEQKAVEGEVEEAFLKIAKELGVDKAEGYTQSTDDAPGKPAADADGSLNPMKSLHLPAQQLKLYVKNPQHWEHSKLAPTVASRTWKLFKAINKDATPEECVEMMTVSKDDAEIPDEAKGLIAAAAKSVKDKWQKRFGACGKASCSKDLLCSKCCKKLAEKVRAKHVTKTPPPSGASELGRALWSVLDNKYGRMLTADAVAAELRGVSAEEVLEEARNLRGVRISGTTLGIGKKMSKDISPASTNNTDELTPQSTIANEEGTPESGGTDDAGQLKGLLKRARRKAGGMEEEEKGTADEMTGDPAQVDADVHELSEDEVEQAFMKRLDRLESKGNELASTIYRNTCAKV